MSKLTKLVNSPGLFLRDAMLNARAGQNAAVPKAPPKPKSKTLDLARVNPLARYELILHSGEGALGLAHFTQWMPAFINSGVKFVVVLRSPNLFAEFVLRYPSAEVAFIASATDLDVFVQAYSSLRFVCYPSNTGHNIHLVRHTHLRHVFIGHGDSDKSASAHKLFRMFDEVWTAGQAHVDRFRNAGFPLGALEFHKVGRPRSTVGRQMAQHSWVKRMKLGARFLYLPTWEGYFEDADYASLRIAGDVLTGLLKEFPDSRVSAKFHPFSGKRLRLYEEMLHGLEWLATEEGLEERIQAIPKETPVEDVIPDANLFICDISAVVTDCLIADCPIFVFVPKDRTITLSKSSMSYEDYAYVYSTPAELFTQIKRVLEEGDTLAAARKEAREYILGISASEAGAFQKNIDRLRNHREPSAE